VCRYPRNTSNFLFGDCCFVERSIRSIKNIIISEGYILILKWLMEKILHRLVRNVFFAAILKEVFGHRKWCRIFSIKLTILFGKDPARDMFSEWSEVSDACLCTQYQTIDGASFARICRVMRFVYQDLTDVFVKE